MCQGGTGAPGPACAIPMGNMDDPLRDAGEYYPQVAYVGGSVGFSSSAIGNTAQIIHYNSH
ncbi:MAG TPA: hypothetical protein VJQ06_01105 [Rhizomicrobium sp.]|nr:hypothetical protein [Rhizomicrobium sp.]